MAVIRSGKYVATNPRSIAGAVKRGWHVVEPSQHYGPKYNVSWLGLVIWTERNANGNWLSDYSKRQFAFDCVEDASKFLFAWGLR